MRQNYNYQIRHESYNICGINDFYREEYKKVFIKINSTWRLKRLSLFSFYVRETNMREALLPFDGKRLDGYTFANI